MSDSSLLALDVGSRRIGVAVAGLETRLPRPLTTIKVDGHELEQIERLIKDHQAKVLVVGLPRNLSGEETAQTQSVKEFADKLSGLGPELVMQDEALTSHQAETELNQRKRRYQKEDVDALAATYLAEDYLREHS